MIIEIHGGGFKNKGAELMLLTVLKVFSEKYPNVRFCVNPTVHDDTADCKRHGLLEYFKVPKSRGGRLFEIRFVLNRMIGKLVTKKYLDVNNLVRYKDVDALIDISGVRFSDKAGSIAGKNFIHLAKYFKKQGKPVILLPQMFGPFNNIESAALFKELEREVALIFARDKVSFGYMKQITPNSNIIYRAPDITVTTKLQSNKTKVDAKNKYGCIVPNIRMLDRGDQGWSEIYVERLSLAAKKMHQKSIKPIILVHSVDGGEDQPLAEAIKQNVGGDICSIKIASDPLETKEFISGSEFLVGSRYHSIVSALSSGVPSVVMGWAHKYETILQDFGMEGYIYNVGDDEAVLSSILDRILDVDTHDNLCHTISGKIDIMSLENADMWGQVFNTLGLEAK